MYRVLCLMCACVVVETVLSPQIRAHNAADQDPLKIDVKNKTSDLIPSFRGFSESKYYCIEGNFRRIIFSQICSWPNIRKNKICELGVFVVLSCDCG